MLSVGCRKWRNSCLLLDLKIYWEKDFQLQANTWNTTLICVSLAQMFIQKTHLKFVDEESSQKGDQQLTWEEWDTQKNIAQCLLGYQRRDVALSSQRTTMQKEVYCVMLLHSHKSLLGLRLLYGFWHWTARHAQTSASKSCNLSFHFRTGLTLWCFILDAASTFTGPLKVKPWAVSWSQLAKRHLRLETQTWAQNAGKESLVSKCESQIKLAKLGLQGEHT